MTLEPKLEKELEVKDRKTESILDYEHSTGSRDDPGARKNKSPKADKMCPELCM